MCGGASYKKVKVLLIQRSCWAWLDRLVLREGVVVMRGHERGRKDRSIKKIKLSSLSSSRYAESGSLTFF